MVETEGVPVLVTVSEGLRDFVLVPLGVSETDMV